jgi:hypothetical protein
MFQHMKLTKCQISNTKQTWHTINNTLNKGRSLWTEVLLEKTIVIQVVRILKHHINTVGVTSFLRNILHSLQEQQKCNQTPKQRPDRNTDWNLQG